MKTHTTLATIAAALLRRCARRAQRAGRRRAGRRAPPPSVPRRRAARRRRRPRAAPLPIAPPPPPPPAPPSPIESAAAAVAAARRARVGGWRARAGRAPAAVRLPRGVHARPLRRLAVVTFHGVQWPYYPRTGIGVSGYGWIDNWLRADQHRRPDRDVDRTREYLQQGRSLLRVTPTYSRGDFFVQAQAEIVANKDQSATQADARHRRRRRRLGAHRPVAEVGPDVRPLRGVRDLPPRHGPRHQHRGAPGRLRRRATSRPTSTARRTCSIARAAPATSPFTSTRTAILRIELLAQYGGSRPVQRARRAPGGHLRHRLAEAEGGRRVPVADRAHRRATRSEKQNRGFAASAQFVSRPSSRAASTTATRTTACSRRTATSTSTRRRSPASAGSPTHRRSASWTARGIPSRRSAGGRRLQLRVHGERALQHADRLRPTSRPTRRLRRGPVPGRQAAVREAGGRLRELALRAVVQHVAPYNDKMYSARLRVLYLF